jgi:hypothetical protein
VWISGAVVKVSYITPELRPKLDIAFNAIQNASIKLEPENLLYKYSIIVK